MAEGTEKPRLLALAELLDRHGVEFLVVGGQAAVLHGSPLPTFDVDLCYRRTAGNLERLAAALPLDLLAWLEPFETYESLIGRAEQVDLGSVRVRVISLDDLIAIKRHINQPKDQVAALQLEALRRLREAGEK